MINDDYQGIANLLGITPPRKKPKVLTPEDPPRSFADTMIRMEPLNLPKNVLKKDEFGYTPAQNKEITKQFTQDTSKSKRAWKAFVKANDDPQRPKDIPAVEYMEQMKNKHGGYKNYSSTPISKTPPVSQKQKISVLDYVDSMVAIHEPETATSKQKEVLKRVMRNAYSIDA